MKMMARVLMLVLAVGVACVAARAQSEDQFFAGTEKFAKGAKSVSEVTLDQKTLKMASGFIGRDNDPDSEDVKRITANLKGVFVRSYEYDSDGGYNAADLEEYRKRLDGQNQWSHIVKVRENGPHGESTDVYLLMENGKTNGIVVISAEPRELTFVHIDGPINPEDLNKLNGSMGIPRSTTPKAERKRDKKEDKSESTEAKRPPALMVML
jgi:Domain of unknown function (DUF4252)